MKTILTLQDNIEGQLSILIKNSFLDKTELCKIMSECGSDKCSDWHNYTPVYFELFSKSKDKSINFFELGLFKGCSIKGWEKFFPGASIYGADIDINYLVNNQRTRSFQCDQEKPESIQNLWKNFEYKDFFDVMIDDGKHEFFSNLIFLRNSIDMLRKGGIYIIEDLTESTSSSFYSILNSLKKELSLEEIFILDIPNNHNTIDNRLLVIRK